MKILVLGITGMLGNAMFKVLSANNNFKVFGTVRSEKSKQFFQEDLAQNIIADIDVLSHDSLVESYATAQPDYVINCVGLVKQLSEVNNPLNAVPINTLLPHRLAALCKATNSRLVHFSTDCVFSGKKGNYSENDIPDAADVYGRSKLLGEVDYPHALTIRTSIIGHELAGHRSLINWFLSQEGSVNGFTNAIYSGLPTVELSNIVNNLILTNSKIYGLYHVGSQPINKYELLQLVKQVYNKEIVIKPVTEPMIDRSLNSVKFCEATGYKAPSWRELIKLMHDFNNK